MGFGPKLNIPDSITIGTKKFERTREFTYLGSLFTEDMSDERDMEERLEIGHRRVGQMNKFFHHKEIPPRLKARVLVSFIYPAISWGCETWVLRQSDLSDLDTWWNRKLRLCQCIAKHDLRGETPL